MSGAQDTPLFRWMLGHAGWTFALMGAAFLAFGAASLNLVQYFAANLDFLAMHGLDAVREGGLRQLFELLVSAYVAVACYLLFKTCEQALVQRLSRRRENAQ
jgi:hypothetical protein